MHQRPHSNRLGSLQLPRDGDARVGKIGAVGASANGPFEVCAQRRMLGTDTTHGLSDRARHTGSGALCRGTDASIASSESNRAGQLAREEVAFGRLPAPPVMRPPMLAPPPDRPQSL